MNKWVSVVLCICGLGLGGMMRTGTYRKCALYHGWED